MRTYLDSAREGKRPITFSRYAGPGSHRYPVGFSGDTVTSWDSLDFQPYFTATAANIGYGWWSHDIGGHMFGTRDDEMVARWFQLGTFSPINRLHSTASPFMGKEPWMFGIEARTVMTEALRLRHRLVPYLYTMNEVAHRTGTPLVRPLYHADPREETVFSSLNTFLFGSELLVAPATTPRDRRTLRTATTAWLPEGTWVDFFDGTPYSGGRFVTLHRTLEQYPVLAKAGAIVPLVGGEDLNVANPAALTVRVFAGADGAFTLYEDDDAAEPRSRHGRRFGLGSGVRHLRHRPRTRETPPWYRRAVPGRSNWSASRPCRGRLPPGSAYDAASGTLRVEVGAVEPAPSAPRCGSPAPTGAGSSRMRTHACSR
jgi:alpha-glucosidase (family GH31 glycosyl hydrolase)